MTTTAATAATAAASATAAVFLRAKRNDRTRSRLRDGRRRLSFSWGRCG